MIGLSWFIGGSHDSRAQLPDIREFLRFHASNKTAVVEFYHAAKAREVWSFWSPTPLGTCGMITWYNLYRTHFPRFPTLVGRSNKTWISSASFVEAIAAGMVPAGTGWQGTRDLCGNTGSSKVRIRSCRRCLIYTHYTRFVAKWPCLRYGQIESLRCLMYVINWTIGYSITLGLPPVKMFAFCQGEKALKLGDELASLAILGKWFKRFDVCQNNHFDVFDVFDGNCDCDFSKYKSIWYVTICPSRYCLFVISEYRIQVVLENRFFYRMALARPPSSITAQAQTPARGDGRCSPLTWGASGLLPCVEMPAIETYCLNLF